MDAELAAAFNSITSIRDSLNNYIISIGDDVRSDQNIYRDQIEFLTFAARRAPLSNAQLMQDLWVLYEMKQKRGGYFVEFGVCDGSTLSNTLLLEEVFGWKGAVAEPAKSWHEKLYARRNCYISDKCVYSEGGLKVVFNETNSAEYSTLDALSDSDSHANIRRSGRRYDVETISLRELLITADAPKDIDYISLDTEGSEYDIIKDFDFSEYNIGLITVEHNYTSRRNDIFDILTRNGYQRKFQAFSNWDDWYIKA